MHGKDFVLGQQVVHHRKHCLLQLACILHTSNQDLSFTYADDDCHIRIRAIPFRNTPELGGAQYLPYWLVSRIELFRNDKQRSREHLMPCVLSADMHWLVVDRVSSDVHHPAVALAFVYIRTNTSPQTCELCCIELLIDSSPVNTVGCRLISDDESIFRRPTRTRPGLNRDRAI